MVHQYPFVHGWLTVKSVLHVVYIILGMRAAGDGAELRAHAR
jgi:uncharacterized membrane protein SirB2